jgi:hypothetical protein
MATFRRPGPAVGGEPAGDDPDARRLESTYPQAQTGTGVLNGVAMRSGLLGLLVAHAARCPPRRRS